MARLPKRPPRHRPHFRPSHPRTRPNYTNKQSHGAQSNHRTKTTAMTAKTSTPPTTFRSPAPLYHHLPQPRRMDHSTTVQNHHKPHSLNHPHHNAALHRTTHPKHTTELRTSMGLHRSHRTPPPPRHRPVATRLGVPRHPYLRRLRRKTLAQTPPPRHFRP